jgi:hypothetical protein
MSYPVIAYKLSLSLDFLSSLAEDPMDRKYGEAEIYNAWVYKPTQAEEVGSGLIELAEPYEVPEPVDWVGFLDDRLHYTDYLYNDLSWPLISKRMLYILRSVGEFSHRVISTRIYDYGFQDQGENNYENLATLPAGEFNEDYVGLQLLEHVDGINYEQTEFRPSVNPAILPPQITNLVLQEPVGGFPPVFRLNRAGENIFLFVSPAAKEALEEAGIKGLDFFPKKGTRAQEASTAS